MLNKEKAMKALNITLNIAFWMIVVVGSFYAYDQYKKKTEKLYVIDVQKVFQLKQSTLTLTNATESDVMKYYDSLEKMVKYSNSFINQVSKEKGVLVYSKNYVLTTESEKMVDLTSVLIEKLREEKLLP